MPRPRGPNQNKNIVSHGNENLCRDRTCTRNKVGNTDFCKLHQPKPPAPIDPAKLKKMTARR